MQEDFEYQVPTPAGHHSAISIYSDRPHLRDEIEDDLQSAGLNILRTRELEAVLDGEAIAGDVILLDCSYVDAQRMAALARLDMRIANSSAHLIVSTSMAALDAVFAAFDQSSPQMLVDPSRAERIVAIGHAMGSAAGARLNELGNEDRLLLVQLAQQVESLARRLDGYGKGHRLEGERNQLEEGRDGFKGFDTRDGNVKADLPDPRLVRRIIRNRQLRAKFFEPALFADPAWDMLLDLTAARAEGVEVAVTSLCLASGVPATTALRWIKQMVEAGIFVRVEDQHDKRRANLSLSDNAAEAMALYFAKIGDEGLAVAA